MPTDPTYLVLADDGAQYGPIAETDLRVWIQEGRVGAQNQAWLEGSPDWKPLANHAAFRGLFAPPPPPPRPPAAPPIAPAREVPVGSGRGLAHDAGGGKPVPASTTDFLSRMYGDEGPFIEVGTQFTYKKVKWVGPILASPAAIYLVKQHQYEEGPHVHGEGLVALAAVAVITARNLFPRCDDDCSNCPIVVIPQRAITRVQSSKVNSVIKVEVGSDACKLIITKLWRMRQVPRELEQLGWTLNQPLTPDPAAVQEWLESNRG